MVSIVAALIIIIKCTRKKQTFISLHEYPRVVESLIKNKPVILQELNNLIKSEKQWSVWDEKNYSGKKKHFSHSTHDEIIERLNAKKIKPETKDNTWTLYGFILNGKTISENAKNVPQTLQIIKSLPGVVNAGFSCLAPNKSTGYHKEIDMGFHRVHLPLIIPKGDCAIKVGSDVRKWIDEDILIFDDRKMHCAWNNTKEYRYVMVVDVLRPDYV